MDRTVGPSIKTAMLNNVPGTSTWRPLLSSVQQSEIGDHVVAPRFSDELYECEYRLKLITASIISQITQRYRSSALCLVATRISKAEGNQQGYFKQVDLYHISLDTAIKFNLRRRTSDNVCPMMALLQLMLRANGPSWPCKQNSQYPNSYITLARSR